MTNTPQDIRLDLQWMYELSLAIGHSLDPYDVCCNFCKVLMRQTEINYAGIWIQSESTTAKQEHDNYELYFSFPHSRTLRTKLNAKALAIEKHQDFAVFPLSDQPQALVIEEHSSDSSVAIFRLGSFGYIRLLREKSEFNQKELRQLRPIIENLAINLEGALAHQQLNKERTFLRSLINTMPELVWSKDVEGRYLSCNPRVESLFAAKEHQIIGQTDYDFFDKDLADFCQASDKQVLARKDLKIERKWVTFANDGHQALIETTKAPMKGDSGETIGILGVGHDITPLYKTQMALKSSEQRFRSYFDLGLIGMALISKKKTWLQVNDYLCDMLGFTESELKRDSLDKFIHPQDISAFNHMTDQLLSRAKSSVRGEVRFIHQSGQIVYTETAISQEISPPEETDHFVTLISDITERKRAEEQIKLSASVFEHASEGIMITDNTGVILDVNRSFQNLSGYSAEDVIGHTPDVLKSDLHSQEFFSAMWKSLIKDGHWRGEIWNSKKSGEAYAELLNVTAILDNEGKPSHYVCIFSDITQLKEHQQELEKMAHFDALTQLPNRVLLSKTLQTALKRCSRTQQLMAVAYIDLDEFKPINDAYGHDTGDLLLIEAAKRMQDVLQADDTIARLGGDEFVMLLQALESVEECKAILSQIIAVLSVPFYINHHTLEISASIGVTLFPDDKSDADTLIRHADQAMYIAKQTGRNCFHFFDHDYDKQARDRHKAQGDIQMALNNNEFVLYYQPKINMRSGKVYGVEALIRWQHPTQNLLLPDSFLPQIENPDLIASLGSWVMEEAISQLRTWRLAGLDLSISINISAEHLLSGRFVKQLEGLLDKYSEVPPEMIEFEVLESAELEDVDTALKIIEHCHELGIQFALDDFGTGYSSLTYLRKIPVNTIKIDKSFVIDMLRVPEDKTIVEGIIGLGRAFGRKVIAEGVESAAHGYSLMQMNCEYAQGYGIAKPMPAELIPDWVANFLLSEHWR